MSVYWCLDMVLHNQDQTVHLTEDDAMNFVHEIQVLAREHGQELVLLALEEDLFSSEESEED